LGGQSRRTRRPTAARGLALDRIGPGDAWVSADLRRGTAGPRWSAGAAHRPAAPAAPPVPAGAAEVGKPKRYAAALPVVEGSGAGSWHSLPPRGDLRGDPMDQPLLRRRLGRRPAGKATRAWHR